jgi:hypothetical protein
MDDVISQYHRHLAVGHSSSSVYSSRVDVALGCSDNSQHREDMQWTCREDEHWGNCDEGEEAMTKDGCSNNSCNGCVVVAQQEQEQEHGVVQYQRVGPVPANWFTDLAFTSCCNNNANTTRNHHSLSALSWHNPPSVSAIAVPSVTNGLTQSAAFNELASTGETTSTSTSMKLHGLITPPSDATRRLCQDVSTSSMSPTHSVTSPFNDYVNNMSPPVQPNVAYHSFASSNINVMSTALNVNCSARLSSLRPPEQTRTTADGAQRRGKLFVEDASCLSTSSVDNTCLSGCPASSHGTRQRSRGQSRGLHQRISVQVNKHEDRYKKESHNIIERRRRSTINDKINEIGSLLPALKDFRNNKGTILKASVDYIRQLQVEQRRLLTVETAYRQVCDINRQLTRSLQQMESLLVQYQQQQSSVDMSSVGQRQHLIQSPVHHQQFTIGNCNGPSSAKHVTQVSSCINITQSISQSLSQSPHQSYSAWTL